MRPGLGLHSCCTPAPGVNAQDQVRTLNHGMSCRAPRATAGLGERDLSSCWTQLAKIFSFVELPRRCLPRAGRRNMTCVFVAESCLELPFELCFCEQCHMLLSTILQAASCLCCLSHLTGTGEVFGLCLYPPGLVL
jgi:hypothetical protein